MCVIVELTINRCALFNGACVRACVCVCVCMCFFCRVDSYHGNTMLAILDRLSGLQSKSYASKRTPTLTAYGSRMNSKVVFSQYETIINEKLPDDFIVSEVRSRLQKMGAILPMNLFLRQEIDHVQNIITTVKSTMAEIQRAMDGDVTLTESTADDVTSLQKAQAPKSWMKVMFALVSRDTVTTLAVPQCTLRFSVHSVSRISGL